MRKQDKRRRLEKEKENKGKKMKVWDEGKQKERRYLIRHCLIWHLCFKWHMEWHHCSRLAATQPAWRTAQVEKAMQQNFNSSSTSSQQEVLNMRHNSTHCKLHVIRSVRRNGHI